MTSATAKARLRFSPFQIFKYTIYGLLAFNVLMFLREEWVAVAHTFAGGLPVSKIVDAFPATIDTAAWVILLLMFELETCVIPGEKLTGYVQGTLNVLRAVCYLFIVYAFYGYITNLIAQFQIAVIQLTDACQLASSDASFLIDLDEYVQIDPGNCAALPITDVMFEVTAYDQRIISDANTMHLAQRLAWTDVINAADWILVVLLLELDVQLQLRGKLRGTLLFYSKATKVILYSVLLICAVYWGLDGDFIDFWDALLWLVAFAFIEMNIFEWQAETNPDVKVQEALSP